METLAIRRVLIHRRFGARHQIHVGEPAGCRRPSRRKHRVHDLKSYIPIVRRKAQW